MDNYRIITIYSVAVDLLLIVSLIVGFCVCWMFCCPFQFCNHLDGDERAGCFTCLSSWCLCGCFVDLPHGAMVGLYLVIVVSPGDIHLPLWEQLSE